MRYVASLLCLVALVGTAARSLSADEKKPESKSTVQFMNFPGLPTCLMGSVKNGDPTKGAFVIIAKATAGCTVPWHWHTATEQLMFITGSAKVGMKDGPAQTLHAADYIALPGKGVHEFTCLASCKLFISSDAAFDIHYVDASGKEISADEALKSKAKSAKPKM